MTVGGPAGGRVLREGHRERGGESGMQEFPVREHDSVTILNGAIERAPDPIETPDPETIGGLRIWNDAKDAD